MDDEQWVPGFADGNDDDPVGMAIAPDDYAGSVVDPGEDLHALAFHGGYQIICRCGNVVDTLEGDKAAIDGKTMQLIQLGVSAQIPCTYCVYYHTRAAKAAGASDAEIKAAIAAAADTRMWSTVLNGNAYDMNAFKAEVDSLIPLN